MKVLKNVCYTTHGRVTDDYEPIIPDSWWDRQVGGSPEEKTIARLRMENDKLRKYAELDTDEADDETTSILSAMREIGIEVRG